MIDTARIKELRNLFGPSRLAEVIVARHTCADLLAILDDYERAEQRARDATRRWEELVEVTSTRTDQAKEKANE